MSAAVQERYFIEDGVYRNRDDGFTVILDCEACGDFSDVGMARDYLDVLQFDRNLRRAAVQEELTRTLADRANRARERERARITAEEQVRQDARRARAAEAREREEAWQRFDRAERDRTAAYRACGPEWYAVNTFPHSYRATLEAEQTTLTKAEMRLQAAHAIAAACDDA